jgi:anti-sigma-K factor RskA
MSASGPRAQPPEEFVDLLIKQVTEGLLPDEALKLDELDAATAIACRDELERSVAAVTVAGTAADAVALPTPLRVRLEQQAAVYFRAPIHQPAAVQAEQPALGAVSIADRSPNPQVLPADPTRSVADLGSRRAAAEPPRYPASSRGVLGWWAAAACLLLALFAWFRPVAAPTAADLRARLLDQPEVIKVPLGATQDPAAAGVHGDVVWDPRTQRGYVHFQGLPPNDPRAQQYQIWIFDGERDARYPIDGGLFNVGLRDEDVVVPIRVMIPVHVAKAFAVTIEKAGGVVVSTRDHVVAIGQTT